MKSILQIIILVLIPAFLGSCSKNYNEIENFEWKLDRIETASGFSSTLPSIESPATEDRYLLHFDKESASVNMFLVVNKWEAHYEITNSETIVMSGNTTTEIGYDGDGIWVEDTLNAYGSDTFRYTVKAKKLSLQSDRATLIFHCKD